MDFFDSLKDRGKKAEEFFSDPSVSQARKDMKKKAYLELKIVLDAMEKMYVSKNGMKFCFNSEYVWFENGAKVDTRDVLNFEDVVETDQIKVLYLLEKFGGRVYAKKEFIDLFEIMRF